MAGRGIVHRGRSDAACGLWGGSGNCARQRAAGTRLGIGAHVAHDRHQSGIERRSATCIADAEHDDCRCASCAGRTGNAQTEYFCAGKSAGAPRKSWGADHRAGPNSEPIGVVRRGGASRDRSTSRGAGAASALQRQRLYCGLSFIPRIRLHLSAERRAAEALFEVSARREHPCDWFPHFCFRTRRNRHGDRSVSLRDQFRCADGTMQFLVYLTVLMISVSTVLLEIHWLTTAPPQPKPTIGTAAAPPPAKPDGPNGALSLVYPKPKPSDADTRQSLSSDTSASSAPEKVAPAQEPTAPSASVTSPQNSSAETTGVSPRDEGVRKADVSAISSNSATERQEPATAAAPPSNRCDVQACASAYRSFRASDCTYQPFEGSRRFCLKAPGQQTARDQREPERRRWSRNVEPRSVDHATVSRRLDNDVDDEDDGAEFDDAPRDAPALFFFGRRPRW